MAQYVCSICSYVYDDAAGIPDAGIVPGTRWEDISDDWKCPICGAGKDVFYQKEDTHQEKQKNEKPHVDKALSPMEMSIICSNLARGCEKQYLPEQSDGFQKLAEFFRTKAETPKTANTQTLASCIQKGTPIGYPCPFARKMKDLIQKDIGDQIRILDYTH